MAASLEQRMAALSKQFDRMERSLQSLSDALSARPASAAGQLSVPDSGRGEAVDGTRLRALQPCSKDTPEVAALRRWCLDHGLSKSVFMWVPSEYYCRPLPWRRDILGAPTIRHLCKTIVLENTHCVNGDCSVRENSRYYMIVYQYVERFDTEMVMRLIKEMNKGIGKKKFNFRLASPEKSEEFTGFTHGAVAPFGTRVGIPVILSQKVAELSPPCFWLGGGHVDCKVCVDTAEFIQVVNPIIAPITVSMAEEELNQVIN